MVTVQFNLYDSDIFCNTFPWVSARNWFSVHMHTYIEETRYPGNLKKVIIVILEFGQSKSDKHALLNGSFYRL